MGSDGSEIDEGCWRRIKDILTNDVWWWILSKGNSPKEQMTFYERWLVKDPLQRIWFEEGAKGLKHIRRRFEIIEASFASAEQVSVFWRYLKLHVSDWADSIWVRKLTSGAMIRMKTISSDSACRRNAKDRNCGVRNWRRMKDVLRRSQYF